MTPAESLWPESSWPESSWPESSWPESSWPESSWVFPFNAAARAAAPRLRSTSPVPRDPFLKWLLEGQCLKRANDNLVANVHVSQVCVCLTSVSSMVESSIFKLLIALRFVWRPSRFWPVEKSRQGDSRSVVIAGTSAKRPKKLELPEICARNLRFYVRNRSRLRSINLQVQRQRYCQVGGPGRTPESGGSGAGYCIRRGPLMSIGPASGSTPRRRATSC